MVLPSFPSHLLGNSQVPDTLLGGRDTERKMTGRDLSREAGVEVWEIARPTKALIQAREP